MKQGKSNLDEQQERKLLEIESRGCWLAFWGLVAAFLVQALIFRNALAIIGEGILTIGLSFYLGISSIHAGIWDRRMDMSRKSRLILCGIIGICTVVFMFGYSFLRSTKLIDALKTGAIFGTVSFLVVYLALALFARVTKKRQDKLNAEPDDELDDTDPH